MENDRIRTSALKSPIQISPEIDFLHFTWYNDRAHLSYEFNSSSTDLDIVLAPLLSIAEKGHVPRHASSKTSRRMFVLKSIETFPLAFTVFFPCRQKRSANVSIVFHFFNATEPIVTIRLEKSCRLQPINRSLLNEFARIDDYLLLRECETTPW